MEIQIPRAVFAKVMHWVNKSTDEVSGFGKIIHYPETGVFEVQDAHLIKQKNGASHTDIDGQALAKLMFTTKDAPGELRWWWHSHVNMAVFWSGTDRKTIEELGSQGWIAATVFNKKEEMRSAISYKSKSDFGEIQEMKDEVPTFVMDPAFDDLKPDWDKEYDEKVEKSYSGTSTYSPHTSYGKGYESYEDYQERHYPKGQTLLTDVSESRFAEDRGAERMGYAKEGYYGFGGRKEADALGIPLPKYLDILCEGNTKILDSIDNRLAELVEKGELF